jgi:branched-chain amino acid aminotransferase
VQECGTMNVFFIIGDTAYTPGLEEGTILSGVTRESVITLLKDMGLKVEERSLSIDEIMDAYKAGNLREAFGTGTAATISMIKELYYKDYIMKFSVDKWKIAPQIKQRMTDIKLGIAPDIYNWIFRV